MIRFVRLLVVIFAALIISPAQAKPGCNDAKLFGKGLVTDICWSCVLPVRVFGVGGSSTVDPPGANRNPFCQCLDDLGVPEFGFSVGAWLPYRLVETVRNPYCMPSLGGIFLRNDWTALAGSASSQVPSPQEQKGDAYYHTHVYSFPLATMMELLTSKECNPGGFDDMDVIMMSEFDPTANDEMLGVFIYFETAMFANPLAIAACSVECGTLTAGIPPASSQVWWCAGCWGSLYPLANRTGVDASLHVDSSLVAVRQLALKHRRGMGHKTYGSDNMCGGSMEVFLPKEQYRWQHLFPIPQAKKPCCHWTGTSEFLTGNVSRNRPYSGEDAIQLLFRYTDCCTR